MSNMPLPPDPYEALGLEKDCDADAIKKAHRKLVLKHHPDRIKDPALVEHNKNEFQKVQQAYEVLIDPTRRQRYDDECKLAQLRRERMMTDGPRTTYTKTTYTARPSPAPTQPVQRDYQPEPRYAYEERVPDSPYFEPTSRGFEDSIPRGTAKKVDPKVDPYEKRSSTSKPAERKEKPKASGWERHGPAMKMAFQMKARGQEAKARLAEKRDSKDRDTKDRDLKERELKEREKEKEIEEKKQREKEMYAKAAKARDKEEARNRDLKNTNRRPQPFVEDESDDESSESDADTIRDQRRPPMRERSPAQKTRRAVTPEPTKSRRTLSPYSDIRLPRQQSPRSTSRTTQQASPRLDPRYARQSSPRPVRTHSPQPMRSDQRSMYDDEDESEDEKYERQFRHAQGYQNIAARKDPRPTPSRQGSDIREYWQADTGRKSGSDDSDKQRPSSSQKSSRRSMPDEGRLRPPLPTQTSAPVGVRNAASMANDPRAKPHSRQNSYTSGNHRREIPELKRSGSEPGPSKVPSKREGPMKGSSLKQTESAVNHDSGYGSSSSPQTPENRGDSPPRDSRPSLPRETSTRYSVKRDDDSVRAKKMTAEDDVPLSRFLSPQDTPHHHHHHHHPESRERRSSRSGERESEGRHRSGSNRPAMSERRPSFSRNESSSRYEEREKPRNIRTEKSPERSGFFRSWDADQVRTTRPKAATYASSHAPNVSKFYEGSTVSRSANARRPSAPFLNGIRSVGT